jgi:hypothetical protein
MNYPGQSRAAEKQNDQASAWYYKQGTPTEFRRIKLHFATFDLQIGLRLRLARRSIRPIWLPVNQR